MIASIEFLYEAGCEKYQRVAVGFVVEPGDFQIAFFVVIMRVRLDLSLEQDQIVFSAPLAFFLWGMVSGVLHTKSGVREILEKSIIIHRSISIFFSL